MGTYLRFTPGEYGALCRAARSAPAVRTPRNLQRLLAAALQGEMPALAGRVTALGKDQARLLHEHLGGREALPPGAAGGGCELSVREWQELARASAAVWLRDDTLPPFQVLLVRHLRGDCPT